MRRAVSSFSLLLLLVVPAWSSVDYPQLHQQISGDDAKAVARLKALPQQEILDPRLRATVRAVTDGDTTKLEEVRASVAVKAAISGATGTAPASSEVAKNLQEIKSSPMYQDAGVKDSSNWLARAFERLAKLFQPKDRDMDLPRANLGGAGEWLVILMWVALGGMLVLFAFLAARHFRKLSRQKLKSKALLDADEPERTLDEWLGLAGQLESEGKFREAVRCLYLACLLKFDEHRVARFDRGETNWEHLRRIASSPALPQGLDFEPPTKAFDRIWYGMRVRGAEDVEEFRGWYGAVKGALERRP
ncbi:MAG TPA: DUF4129 domain-containing protein [Fimbriimonadaceae bacterium]|nr:DUF4129 domain-containing protein [Fimbriimonadaceae bacterium]